MLALGSVQPQIAVPALHLANIWNKLHNVSRQLARSPGRQGQCHATAATTQEDAAIGIQELSAGTGETLHELGLHLLARDVKIESINVLLPPDITTRGQDEWHTSHVSSDSFFTNKHGHTQQELLQHIPSNIRLSLLLPSPAKNTALTTRWLPQTFFQQTRGFKTKRAQNITGMRHTESKEQNDITPGTFFKNIVGIRVPPPKPSSSDGILKQSTEQLSPDVNNKVKLAFTEGYIIGQQNEPPAQKRWQKFWKPFLILMVMLSAGPVLLSYLYNGWNRFSKSFTLMGDSVDVVQGDDVEETFNDVKGADEVKEELIDIVEFLKNPDKFTALGATLPKGVLLCGPPGCGKTLLARAVAGEANVPFFYAAGAEFDEMFVGVGAKKMRDLFNEAKKRAPCVIFLDEIDAVGSKRSSSELHPYANQTINQLLTEMDGFKQNEGVIILGATNRREYLDSALLRPGRFDVEIHMQPPDFNGRKEILELYLNKVKAGPDIDVDRLARMTSGYTGADIANLVNQATMVAGLRECQSVDMSHLEHAREKIIMGPMKKNRLPDEEINRVTAYHEAGHTIVAYFTKGATPPHKVTIMPRGQSLGHTAFVPEKDVYNMTKKQLLGEMDVAMGGRVAEEIIFGSDEVTTGASSDFQKANAIADNMVKKSGMSEKAGFRIVDDKKTFGGANIEYSGATMELVDNEIKRLLQESYERCKLILKSHSKELKSLAEALLEYETLEREEIKMILDGKRFVKKPPPKSTGGGKSRTVIPAGSSKKAIKAIIEGTKLPNPSGNTVKIESTSEQSTTDS